MKVEILTGLKDITLIIENSFITKTADELCIDEEYCNFRQLLEHASAKTGISELKATLCV